MVMPLAKVSDLKKCYYNLLTKLLILLDLQYLNSTYPLRFFPLENVGCGATSRVPLCQIKLPDLSYQFSSLLRLQLAEKNISINNRLFTFGYYKSVPFSLCLKFFLFGLCIFN